MKRGRDESAIESMAEAADPIILSRSGGEFIEIKQNNLRKQWIIINYQIICFFPFFRMDSNIISLLSYSKCFY